MEKAQEKEEGEEGGKELDMVGGTEGRDKGTEV